MLKGPLFQALPRALLSQEMVLILKCSIHGLHSSLKLAFVHCSILSVLLLAVFCHSILLYHSVSFFYPAVIYLGTPRYFIQIFLSNAIHLSSTYQYLYCAQVYQSEMEYINVLKWLEWQLAMTILLRRRPFPPWSHVSECRQLIGSGTRFGGETRRRHAQQSPAARPRWWSLAPSFSEERRRHALPFCRPFYEPPCAFKRSLRGIPSVQRLSHG